MPSQTSPSSSWSIWSSSCSHCHCHHHHHHLYLIYQLLHKVLIKAFLPVWWACNMYVFLFLANSTCTDHNKLPSVSPDLTKSKLRTGDICPHWKKKRPGSEWIWTPALLSPNSTFCPKWEVSVYAVWWEWYVGSLLESYTDPTSVFFLFVFIAGQRRLLLVFCPTLALELQHTSLQGLRAMKLVWPGIRYQPHQLLKMTSASPWS